MQGDMPEQKQQQESIPAGKGSNFREAGYKTKSGKCLTEENSEQMD